MTDQVLFRGLLKDDVLQAMVDIGGRWLDWSVVVDRRTAQEAYVNVKRNAPGHWQYRIVRGPDRTVVMS